jgi:Xaa-Pro aminopeptidase
VNTLHPVVILGAYGWDQQRLPMDEFGERLRKVRALMRERGWHGVAIHGDCEESGVLAWIANLAPRLRWAVLLVGPAGDPVFLIPGGTRDLPFSAAMTWVRDVRSSFGMAKTIPEWVGTLGQGRAKIGLYGAARMAPATNSAVMRAFEGIATLQAADAELDALARVRRPREMYLVRQSCQLLAQTTATFQAAMRDGAPPGDAALTAERGARIAGAHDVRILLSRDRGVSLEPFFSIDFPREDPVLAYFAVRYLGYWSEGVVNAGTRTTTHDAVDAALKALTDGVRPGARLKDVLASAQAKLKTLEPHPALGSCSVHRIGLSLDEDSAMPSASEAVESGVLYSLCAAGVQAGTGAAASAMIRAGDPQEVLWSSERWHYQAGGQRPGRSSAA